MITTLVLISGLTSNGVGLTVIEAQSVYDNGSTTATSSGTAIVAQTADSETMNEAVADAARVALLVNGITVGPHELAILNPIALRHF